MLASDLLAPSRGLVVAPAGCGKTQLIVEALKEQRGKPALLLTHTHAGVAALRSRLARAGVPKAAFRLATIDGWSLRLAGMFPTRAGYRPDPLAAPDYGALRDAAVKALGSGALDGALKATYDRVLVDEYQDCSVAQHTLVALLANLMPAYVLGDPMQRIFDFAGDPVPEWAEVQEAFPVIGTLSTPWRWRNAGEHEFGAWVLHVREALQSGAAIDLRCAPSNVSWMEKPHDPTARTMTQARAVAGMRRYDNLLVMGDPIRRSAREDLARRSPGFSVVEPVDLEDMQDAARRIDRADAGGRLRATLEFAAKVMTGVQIKPMLARVEVLAHGRARAGPSLAEEASLKLRANGDLHAVAELLDALAGQGRVFRGHVLQAMQETLRLACMTGTDLSLAAGRVRERHRHAGRSLPRRAVGSTLLLKGLEAEHVLVMDADRMNARHLYVAFTRGAKSLTVLASRPVLKADA